MHVRHPFALLLVFLATLLGVSLWFAPFASVTTDTREREPAYDHFCEMDCTELQTYGYQSFGVGCVITDPRPVTCIPRSHVTVF